MTTRPRTLRIRPTDVMTGDLLEIRTSNGHGGTTMVWDAVTTTEPDPQPARGGARWILATVRYQRTSYAGHARVTVKRTGPLGLGE